MMSRGKYWWRGIRSSFRKSTKNLLFFYLCTITLYKMWFLDAIASLSSYSCGWVGDSFRCDAIASPSFVNLFLVNFYIVCQKSLDKVIRQQKFISWFDICNLLGASLLVWMYSYQLVTVLNIWILPLWEGTYQQRKCLPKAIFWQGKTQIWIYFSKKPQN